MDDEFHFTEGTEIFNEPINFDYYIAQDEIDTAKETERGLMITVNKFFDIREFKKGDTMVVKLPDKTLSHATVDSVEQLSEDYNFNGLHKYRVDLLISPD